jgi:translation initiation factor IF-2
LRWVTIVVATSLAAAVPAGAQQPASPDAAPTASHAPQPDPAPVKTTPKAAIAVRPAPRPVAAAPTPAPTATKSVHRAATHRKKAVRRSARAHKATRRPHVAMPPLPRLTLAHLSAPPTTTDAGRARRLAAGALSLLILALASATLLAFTARVERRRVAR